MPLYCSCTAHRYYIKGVVYSARPRAEVDGSAVFEDKAHRLKAVLRFGANKGARAPVMRRSDAITGEIYDVSGQAQVRRGSLRVFLQERCGRVTAF